MPEQRSETPPPRRLNKVSTIIYSALLLVAVLHLLSSLPFFYQLNLSYQQANAVYRLNTISDDLYKAVNNIGFERGRVNVVLLDAGPVAQTEANRQFIATRRSDGERALSQALAGLSAEAFTKAERQTTVLRQQRQTIDQLRSQADAAMLLPKDQRPPQLAARWFSTP